jgi:UDP-glucose 4-epimerase
MKSLVTGGAGFIGAHVVNELIALGHEVIVLDDLSGGFEENINDQAVFVKGSVVETDLVEKLFAEHQFDYVYHLAAYAAEGLSHFIRRFNYQNNLIGSINLINESIKTKVKCFVFTSSIAVYGTGQVPLKETTIPVPEDPYGIAKLAIEQDLKSAHEMFGLDFVIFRPHNVYGRFQNIADKYRNVVGIFMNQLMQGKELSIFGDGTQTRAFSHVSDIAPYIAKSAQMKEVYGETFNIGADKEYTVNELAETVMKSMGLSQDIIHHEARNEVMHAYADHSKVRSAFNIKDEFMSLEDGLNEMADWAKNVGALESSVFGNIEIEENLPPSWVSKK